MAPRTAGVQDILGAAVGGISTLAVVLTLGLLAWGALPGAAATVGLAAAFASATVGGLIVAGLSRGSLPCGSPSSATALLLGGLVAHMVAQAGPGGLDPSAWASVLLGASAAVLLMGLCQIALALLGLARLVDHVPRSVLAGFMNGVGLLVLMSQLPVLLRSWVGLPFGAAHFGPTVLGLGTAGLAWLLAWQRPRWPASLLALLAGVAVWLLLPRLWPGLDLGASVGAAAGGWPVPVAALTLRDHAPWPLLQPNAAAIVSTGLALALIGSMESLLSMAAIEETRQRRPDARHELLVLGCANVVGSLFAALPCVQSRSRALAILAAGGQGRVAGLATALFSGLIFGLAGSALGWIPKAVLAGLMLTLGVALFDRWSMRLLARWWQAPRDASLLPAVAVMATVCGLTALLGLAVGVAAGVLLSTVVFVRGLNRSLIRARLDGTQRPSRRVWPPAAEAVLRQRRDAIALMELEGSLFFGSCQRLIDAADALDGRCRWLVLDLRRVSTVDESGALALQHLAPAWRRQGGQLLLGGLTPGHGIGRSLAALGLDPADPERPWFGSADLALEHAERGLLDGQAPDTAELPLSACALVQGLDDATVAWLRGHMMPRELQAGETLFAQGAAGDGLYVITQGSVSAVGGEGPARQRYSSLSAGNMVGEAALLSGGRRSATIVADTPTRLLELSGAALLQLEQERPAVAVALYRNIGAHLSQRLQAATVAWHASAS